MNKVRLLFFFLFASFFCWAIDEQPVSAEVVKPVHIEVDAGVLTYDSGFHYKLVNDRLLVQASTLIPSLGAKEQHDLVWESVTISKGKMSIVLKAGQHAALVNGKHIRLEVAPVKDRGGLLIPLRFVSETLGVKVEWNAQYRAAVLSTQKKNLGIVDKQMLSLARAGKVKSLSLPLGISRLQIEKQWGKPFDSYYYEGGQFFAYQSCTCSVFYDSQGRSAIYDLSSKKVGYLKVADVRSVLGKPEWEEENATHSDYLLHYPAGEYALTFSATFQEGTIMSLWLQKQEWN